MIYIGLAEFGDVLVSEITKPMANTLLIKEAKRLKKANKSNFKVNSMIRALKALFNYGNRIYDLDLRNPFNLDFYPIEINLKYIPPEEHILAVKAECNEIQKLLLDFVDETGCRIMEAVRFKYSDIDGELITLWTRKSRNSNLTPRRIPKPKCIAGLTGKGTVTTKLAGVTFDQCQKNINLYGPPAITEYELRREPDNQHDPNAIKVGLEPFKFGFVPGHIAKEIAPKMDAGTNFMVESVSVNRSAYHNTVGMTVKITEINN